MKGEENELKVSKMAAEVLLVKGNTPLVPDNDSVRVNIKTKKVITDRLKCFKFHREVTLS